MKRHFLRSTQGSFVALMFVCLMSAASLNAQTGWGDDRPRTNKSPALKQTKDYARPRKSLRAGAVARERGWASKRIRQQAEAAAEARAAHARADEERREKEQVWQVAIVANRTNGPMPYQIRKNGSYETFTLSPGYKRVHFARGPCIAIKYDNNYEPGFQEKRYSLYSAAVVGHEPTEFEKANAKVNYFEADESGEIHLHAQR